MEHNEKASVIESVYVSSSGFADVLTYDGTLYIVSASLFKASDYGASYRASSRYWTKRLEIGTVLHKSVYRNNVKAVAITLKEVIKLKRACKTIAPYIDEMLKRMFKMLSDETYFQTLTMKQRKKNIKKIKKEL